MAKRLNKKVAIIGSLFLVIVVLAAAVYVLKSSKDPNEFISDAEATLVQIDTLIEDLQAKGDYSDEAKESVNELYKSANESYGKAYGCSKDSNQRVEILFTLADFYLIDNPYHQPDWKKAMGCWNQIVTIDNKNLPARQKQIDYYREIEESVCEILPGGNPTLWSEIEKQASELADVISQSGKEVDPEIIKLRGWALMEIADSGQTDDPEGDIGDAIKLFERLLEITPADVEVYEHLARGYLLDGQMKDSRGVGSVLDEARKKQQETLEEGVKFSEDKAQAEINLLNMKLLRAGNNKEQLDILRDEFEALAEKHISNAEVYYILSKFYSLVDAPKLDNAIRVLEKAMSIDSDNLRYALLAANQYYNKAAVENDYDALVKGIETGQAALKYHDARDIPGPRQSAALMYRNVFYKFLAKSYVEQAIFARKNSDEDLNASAVENAGKMIHEIKQIAKANDFIFQKWDGLLAFIKGDNITAIRNLYNAQEILKATDDVDAMVSYYLSKLFEGRSEIGARVTFLSDALINKSEKADFISIANSKPEALLDYAEILVQLRQFDNAKSVAGLFEERYPANIRSRSILVLCDVYSGSFDDAMEKISEMDAGNRDVILLELTLLNRRISFLTEEVRIAQQSAKSEVSSDSILYAKQDLKKYKVKRDEIILKLLKMDGPDDISFPIIAYEDYRKAGLLENAAKLADAFLSRYPENVEARIYRRFLSEKDPANISAERMIEIREEIYGSITDILERYIKLASLYYSNNRSQEAVEYYQKAFEIDPDNRRTAGGLFDAALKAGDLETAGKVLPAAKKNNFDECDGQFFAARLDAAAMDYQSALNKLDNCIKVRPVFPYAYLIKSQVYASLENFDKAVENAAKAASMNTLDGTIAKQVALVINERNQRLGTNVSPSQHLEMKQALIKAVALNPGQWQLQSLYARYISEREPENAIAVQQKLAARIPNVQNNLALGNMALGQATKEVKKEKKRFLLDIAGPAYEKAYSLDPEKNEVIEAYAEFLRVTGKHNKAKELLNGRDTLLWKYHLRDGQFDKSKAILLKLYKSDPSDKEVLGGLMLASQKLSDKEDLKKYSGELLKVDRNDDNELQQIQMYLDAGLVHEAELKLESFRTRNPDEPRALLLEAWATMSRGKLQRALELVSKNLAIDPENAIAWRLRGQIHSLKGDFETAIDDLVKSKNFDDNPAIQIDLANAYNRAGEIDKAIGVLAVALTDDRAPVRIRQMLESLYIQERRNSDLARFYKDTLYKYPESVNWHFRAGRFALQEGRYLQAEDYFFRAWMLDQKEGGSLATLDGYLSSLRGGRKFAETLDFAKDFVDTEFAPVAYLNMANVQHQMDDRAKSLEYYLKAIEKSGDNKAFVLKILGNMMNVIGTEEVVKWCQDRLAQDSGSQTANLMMYRVSQQKGHYEKALSHIDICLNAVDPEELVYLEYLSYKGSVLLEAYVKSSEGKYLDSSIKVYEAILEKRPNNSEVMNNIAYLLADNNMDLQKALKYARRAHEMSPNDANKMDTYAYVLCKTGDYKQAKELLQSALNMLGKENMDISWDVYEHLGMANEGLGDTQAAMAYYEQAIAAAGENISPAKKDNLLKAVKRVSN